MYYLSFMTDRSRSRRGSVPVFTVVSELPSVHSAVRAMRVSSEHCYPLSHYMSEHTTSFRPSQTLTFAQRRSNTTRLAHISQSTLHRTDDPNGGAAQHHRNDQHKGGSHGRQALAEWAVPVSGESQRRELLLRSGVQVARRAVS